MDRFNRKSLAANGSGTGWLPWASSRLDWGLSLSLPDERIRLLHLRG